MKIPNPFRGKTALGAAGRGFPFFTRRPKSESAKQKIAEAIVTEHPNSAMIGLVFGVEWHQHLLRDSVAAAASTTARRVGSNYTFYRHKARSLSTYGVVRIARADKQKFARLVPAAAVFAESLKDKGTESLLLLDLRDENGDGSLFMCMARQGDPMPDREFLGTEDECVELLRKWVHSSSTGVNLLLDLHPGPLLDSLRATHPSSEEYALTDQRIGQDVNLKPVALLPFKKWHAVFFAVILISYFGYDYALKYYQEQIAMERAKTAAQAAVTKYMADRDATYKQGYATSWNVGFADAYSTLNSQTLIRKGWRFEQAVCTIAEKKCRLAWTRVYGTYVSFLDGLDPTTFEIDPSDYTKSAETRTWTDQPQPAPAYSELPDHPSFVKQDGDRKDTLLLSGFTKYETAPLTVMTPWTGQGVPPGGLEIMSATWAIEGGLDMVLELVKSHHLSKEFSSNVITFTNVDGLITVRMEGNLYVRKS